MSLLRQQRDNLEWNASMLPYWESLPGIGDSITKENMPTDALHLLQDPVLAGTHHTDTSPLPNADLLNSDAVSPGVSFQLHAVCLQSLSV